MTNECHISFAHLHVNSFDPQYLVEKYRCIQCDKGLFRLPASDKIFVCPICLTGESIFAEIFNPQTILRIANTDTTDGRHFKKRVELLLSNGGIFYEYIIK